MQRVRSVVFAGVISMLAVTAPAGETEDIHKLRLDTRTIELKLEHFRRLLPPSFDRESEESFIHGAAEAAKMRVATVSHPDQSVSVLSVHRITMSGDGDLDSIRFFLELLHKRDWRLGDIESFRLKRSSGADFSFAAVQLLPTLGSEPQSSIRGDAVRALRLELAQREELLNRLDGWKKRMDKGRLAVARAVLAALPENNAIVIHSVDIAERASLSGVAVAARARGELASALQAGGFGGSRVSIATDGACRPFVADLQAGGSSPSVISQELAAFDASFRSFCEDEAARFLGVVTARGENGLNVKLRSVDVGSVFFVLHDLTDENFVVDTDVSGRMDLEVQNASAAETLAAMRSAGLLVSGPPLRRVSLVGGNRKPAPGEDYTGDPVSLSFHRASLRDVLCLFTQITGLPILAPADLSGRTTIFAGEVSWDRVLKEVLFSAGLQYSLVNNTMVIGDEKPAVSACDDLPRPEHPVRSLLLPLTDVAAADLEIAGTARVGDAWRAYAYTPWRAMRVLEGGEQLFDSRVRSIGPSSVTFETEGGRAFEISFAPLSVPDLVGAWECVSGPCIDPEIEFGIEDKVRVFRSWLHHRPSAAGTWSAEDDVVTAEWSSDRTMRMKIVRVNAKELVLRDTDAEEPAHYRRIVN